ncbi:MAG: T9SS type A sorting domain-containing protein [Bacteroidales bacterium]
MSIHLNDNVTVNDTLTMTQGNINSGDDKITVGESKTNYGTLDYTSGQVIGKYEKWLTNTNHSGVKQFFPVGTDAYCRPAEPTFTIGGGVVGGGTVIAEFVATNPGNGGLPLQDPPQTNPDSIHNTFNEGYWTLTPANGISISGYDLELTGNGFSSFPIDTETRLLTRAGSGNNWTNEGTHVNAVNPTAKRTGLTTFLAHFCFGDDTDCEAPVTSSITGSTSVCTNDTNVVYSVTNTTGSTYTWTITGGTIASGQGTDSIEVNWGSAGMVGNIEVVEHNGCTYGDPVNLSVVIHTIQPSSISGTVFVPVEQTGVSYSVNDTSGYSYTWTITGGTLTSGQGTNSITVDWNSTAGWGEVKVVASGACGSAPSTELDVWKYIVIESITTGNWDDVNTWDCHCVPLETDNVRINNGHTVSVNVSNATVKSLTITAAGVLASGNKGFTATGHVTIDGSFTGTNILTLSGNNTTISGIGTIKNTKELSITGGNKTIASNSMLTKTAGNVDIALGISVTNTGSFGIQNGNLTLSTTSSWENAEYSTLELGGEISLTDGDVFASAFNNTVNYCFAGNQDVRSTTYYHLITSGGAAGTKTLAGHVTVNGNFTIDTAATCDVSTNNYVMYIRGNWTNNGNFIPQLGTVYFEGTSKQTISGTTANTFYNIVINNTTGSNADIMLEDNDLTVSNSATFTQGIVNTDTNTFVFGTSATTNEGSITSFVDGEAEKTSATSAFTFPTGHVTDRDIGDGLQTYKIWAPFSATPAASTNINVRYFYSNNNLHTWWYHDWTHESPLTHTTGREYWLVNSGQNLDVTLSWRNNNPCSIHDFCDGGSQLQYLTTAYWDNIWKDAGGDASGESTVTGDISSFVSVPFAAKGERQITFGGTSKDIPLPIELLNFDVTCDHENDAIDVSWTTASEINNDYFTLYRSIDGISFEEIERITGSGNTSEAQTYAFTDDFAPVGDVYYKLSQTDFNGLTENFMVTSINCFSPDNKISVKVFPNPFRDILNVVFTNWPLGKTTLRLIDMQGHLILQKSENIQGRNTHIQLRFDDISPGMYIFNLRTDKVNKNLKIEKQ